MSSVGTGSGDVGFNPPQIEGKIAQLNTLLPFLHQTTEMPQQYSKQEKE